MSDTNTTPKRETRIVPALIHAVSDYASKSPTQFAVVLLGSMALFFATLIYIVGVGGPELLREVVARPIKESSDAVTVSVDRLNASVERLTKEFAEQNARISRLEALAAPPQSRTDGPNESPQQNE